MAFLVILKDGRPLLRFRLDREETAIGRGNDVDMVVSDARVSRLHFLVRKELDGYRLIDRSSNGTYLNGVKVKASRLKDQDTIIAGACQIRFELDDLEDPPTTVLAVPEGGALSYDAVSDRLLYARPVLLVREGQSEAVRFPIHRDYLRIGSDKGNDVVVTGAAARHCQLLATADGYTLRSLEPSPPALLDEQPVTRDKPVPYGSTIRIGRATMQLVMEEGEEPVVPLEVSSYEGMVGTTDIMHRLFALIDRFARHDAPVMILGETGTGKELVARALHRRGHRARGPFIPINCSAISPQLFESELFGHERGAFTGAVRTRPGAIEAAHKGILFLDELGDLPLELQPKLLRVLETSSITPVGTNESRQIDVRVIAATHKNLHKLVEEGRFRQDLFYRLFVLNVELPPLRARVPDIGPLVRHFLDDMSPPGAPLRVSAAAMHRLTTYSWPGNIRELRHVLTRAVASGQHSEITEQDISFLTPPAPDVAREDAQWPGKVLKLEEMEKKMIERALQLYMNNRKEAARALGIARSTLHMRLKKYGIDADFSDEDPEK